MKTNTKKADLKTRLTLGVPGNEIARLISYAMKHQGWEIGCLKNSSHGELDAAYGPVRENNGKLLGYQFIIWLSWNLIGGNKATSIVDIAIGVGMGRSAVTAPLLRREMYQEIIDSIMTESKMKLESIN